MRLAAPPGECVAGINQNNKKSLSGVGRALFCGPDLWSPLAGPFARLDERACPAGGYFSMMKSSKRFLGRVCGRLAAGQRFCGAQSLYGSPPGDAFCEEEQAKEFWGRICDRLRRGGDFAGCKAGTPTRRRPTFVCARRRGLCSMSGRYPYGIGNPPTLRRSSFPQRALRPAGGPIPKRTWGCAPRPPNA